MCLIDVDDNTDKGNTLGIESIQLPASLKQSVDFTNSERERGHSESNPCLEDMSSEQHSPIASAPQFLCVYGRGYIYQIPITWQGSNHEQGSVWPCGTSGEANSDK